MSLQLAHSGIRIRTALILFVIGVGPRIAIAQPPPPAAPAQPPPATPAQPPPPPETAPAAPAAPAARSPEDGVLFIGAGDIANCEVANGGGARSTAALLDRYPDAVIFTTGDHAYQ